MRPGGQPATMPTYQLVCPLPLSLPLPLPLSLPLYSLPAIYLYTYQLVSPSSSSPSYCIVLSGVSGNLTQAREFFLQSTKLVKRKNNNLEKFCARRVRGEAKGWGLTHLVDLNK